MRNVIVLVVAGLLSVQARAAFPSFGDDFGGTELDPWVAEVCPGGVAEIDALGKLHINSPKWCGAPSAAVVELPSSTIEIEDGFIEFDFDNGPASRMNNHTTFNLRWNPSDPESVPVAVTVWEDTYGSGARYVTSISYSSPGGDVVVASQPGLLEPGRYRFSIFGDRAEFKNVDGGTAIELAADGIPWGTGGLRIHLTEEEIWLDNIWAQVGPGPQPGDSNQDGRLNIADPLFILRYLFAGGPAPFCRQTSDVDCDRALGIGDAMAILGMLFAGKPLPGC